MVWRGVLPDPPLPPEGPRGSCTAPKFSFRYAYLVDLRDKYYDSYTDNKLSLSPLCLTMILMDLKHWLMCSGFERTNCRLLRIPENDDTTVCCLLLAEFPIFYLVVGNTHIILITRVASSFRRIFRDSQLNRVVIPENSCYTRIVFFFSAKGV